jgi:23S rRNA (adenine2503-C2)-methyltransferase
MATASFDSARRGNGAGPTEAHPGPAPAIEKTPEPSDETD